MSTASEACAVFSVLLEQGNDVFEEGEDGVTESRDGATLEEFLLFAPFQYSFAVTQSPEHGLFCLIPHPSPSRCTPNLLMCQVL